jgi:hypothetical protein
MHVMSSLIWRAVVALCTLVVVCPPSLCCQVDLISPCWALPREQAHQAQQKAKAKCNHCCSTEPANSEPTNPAKKAPTPPRPLPQSCCDRQPATPPSGPWQLPIVSELAYDLMPPVVPETSGSAAASPDEIIISPLALHVRHCLWLC